MRKYTFTLFLMLSVLTALAQENQCWYDLPAPENTYPFTPSYEYRGSVFNMQDWLDAPAGKHGFLKVNGDRLQFEDGSPFKMWGTNICSSRPFVEAEVADSFVNFLTVYGINAVRFHKFSAQAYVKNRSTQLDPEKFKRFDYFQSRLREEGMYYGWSHIYGQRVLPGDSSRIMAYEEIRNLEYPWSHLNGSTSSLVNFAPDLQDLSIELTINMLNHLNPYTGLRYADDPALAFIEFQNEDNIYWSAIQRALDQAPTYRALLCKQFSGWLKEKYGDQSALEEAWGPGVLPGGESLEEENIYPEPSHGLFDWAYQQSLETGKPIERNLLDKMAFLHEAQVQYYQRFEKAIRETGYRGVLVGSCWQAGSGLAHYYNLHADYSVGMIDRHNYFGGGAGGHRMATGEVKNSSLLVRPGSGLLSTGLQQLADRPFSFSEWMSLVPNEWTAEATALIAIYGMGLQGWDASFSFATDIPRFSRYLESELHGVYNATSPLHMGLYPALSRMVYRDNVKESPILATRNVHLPSLEEGLLGFTELVKQGYDDKAFSGTVSPEYMAIGRFPARFTETFQETRIPDPGTYWDTINRVIHSRTGELSWYYGDRPHVVLDAPAAKGVIGFTGGKEVHCGNWSIRSDNPFIVTLITPLEGKEGLQTADSILVCTMARARNTGMEYSYRDGKTILDRKGGMPLLLEAVNAEIRSGRKGSFRVEVLDHDGVPTGTRVPVKRGTFVLDGKRYHSPYYLIVYEED